MFKVSTKKDKGSNAVETLVNVIYDSAPAERALATQALIVKAQSVWRKNGIPAECTIRVSEYAPGTRHGGVVNPLEVAKTMSKEDRAKLIEELVKLNTIK